MEIRLIPDLGRVAERENIILMIVDCCLFVNSDERERRSLAIV